MTKSCDNYPELWKYDIKLAFGSDDNLNYIRVPIATFAADYEAIGACALFVEFLDPYFQDSKSIVLGAMFFQSFYAQVEYFGINGV